MLILRTNTEEKLDYSRREVESLDRKINFIKMNYGEKKGLDVEQQTLW